MSGVEATIDQLGFIWGEGGTLTSRWMNCIGCEQTCSGTYLDINTDGLSPTAGSETWPATYDAGKWVLGTPDGEGNVHYIGLYAWFVFPEGHMLYTLLAEYGPPTSMLMQVSANVPWLSTYSVGVGDSFSADGFVSEPPDYLPMFSGSMHTVALTESMQTVLSSTTIPTNLATVFVCADHNGWYGAFNGSIIYAIDRYEDEGAPNEVQFQPIIPLADVETELAISITTLSLYLVIKGTNVSAVESALEVTATGGTPGSFTNPYVDTYRIEIALTTLPSAVFVVNTSDAGVSGILVDFCVNEATYPEPTDLYYDGALWGFTLAAATLE